MRVVLNQSSERPRYQQIVDSVRRDIRTGKLPAGRQLPTVRELAEQCGASQGTIKHAYDTLEQMGLVHKTQGRGTFVRDAPAEPATGKKEQALTAIDGLLDQLHELEFSARDIRIFLDLKMREREQLFENVRIGAVDCSPEALSAMAGQLSALPHVDVYEYLLDPVLEAAGPFEPGLDLVVTTPTHSADLSEKMQPDKEPVRLVMSLSTNTALELAKLPRDARVGVLCASERFCGVVLRTCKQYCTLDNPPKAALFGDDAATSQFLAGVDRLILPPRYLQFTTPGEQALLRNHKEAAPPIFFQYLVDEGSLLHLEEQVVKMYEKNKHMP